MQNALIIGDGERQKLAWLREQANLRPVDMRGIEARLKLPKLKAEHMAQMTAQSVLIPLDYCVTFSIENGHPAGTARHMSMSSGREGMIPRPESVWMVAQELGFVGGMDACMVWIEDLRGHGQAVNVVQPFDTVAAGNV